MAYSYLSCFENNYRKISDINGRIYSGGGDWEIYQCYQNDCIDNERFVADRKYTNNRLTADTFERLRAKIFKWEYEHH